LIYSSVGKPNHHPECSYIKDVTSYGIKAHMGNIMGFLNYRLDMFIVSGFLNPAAVGFYSIAVGMAEKIWLVANSASTVLFPRVSSETDEQKRKEFTPIVSRNVLLISLAGAVALYFLSRWAILLLYSNVYLSSVEPLQILLPGIVALSVAKVLSNDIAGRGKPILNTYMGAITVVTNIGLNIFWFIINLGPYFCISLLSTLLLLDKFSLKRDINFCATHTCGPEEIEEDTLLNEPNIEKRKFIMNLIGLLIFIVLLLAILEIYLAGLIRALIFVLINPIQNKEGKRTLSISKYLSHVDYKLIYFFMALFIFVGLLEANGTIFFIEELISSVSAESEFILAIIILVSTSILSGLIDNTPVTIIFIPIVRFLFNLPEFYLGPLVVAFILGINLGGNFLPQGSAADLATLEISRDNQVDDMSYKRLFKVGGLFALFHVLLGIGYLAVLVFLF